MYDSNLPSRLERCTDNCGPGSFHSRSRAGWASTVEWLTGDGSESVRRAVVANAQFLRKTASLPDRQPTVDLLDLRFSRYEAFSLMTSRASSLRSPLRCLQPASPSTGASSNRTCRA